MGGKSSLVCGLIFRWVDTEESIFNYLAITICGV